MKNLFIIVIESKNDSIRNRKKKKIRKRLCVKKRKLEDLQGNLAIFSELWYNIVRYYTGSEQSEAAIRAERIMCFAHDIIL